LPQVGDFDWQPRTATRTGWVRANARSIGSATSGATERAHADCELLFTTLWNRYSDTICPVIGGRGASAAADWAANKQLTLPDGRARAPFGVDDMGNSAAGRLAPGYVSTGSPTAAMSVGGDDDHTLVTGEIPTHTHAITITDPGHSHSVTGDGAPTLSSSRVAGGTNSSPTIPMSTQTTGITASAANIGGGAAHNNMPPFMLGTWYIFLG